MLHTLITLLIDDVYATPVCRVVTLRLLRCYTLAATRGERRERAYARKEREAMARCCLLRARVRGALVTRCCERVRCCCSLPIDVYVV